MLILIKFFAVLRDRAGTNEASLQLPTNATVADAAAEVTRQFPNLANLLPRTAFALNRSYTQPTTILHQGDELAIIPPVSGG